MKITQNFLSYWFSLIICSLFIIGNNIGYILWLIVAIMYLILVLIENHNN